MKRLFTHCFILALVLATGCSVHRLGERLQLPRHTIHETRMTNAPAAGYVPTGVWRVRGAANTVYLVGTCHLVNDSDIPFPSSFYAAYRDAQDIYFESDPLSFSGTWTTLRAFPELVSWSFKHANELNCPKGRTLDNYVSPETARALRAHYGEDYADIAGSSPLGLLFAHEFAGGDDSAESGVDDLFIYLAHKDGKRVRTLDTTQLSALLVPIMEMVRANFARELAERGADALLKEAILDAKPDAPPLVQWRRGDMSGADKELAEFKKESGRFYEPLLPDRNRAWMPAILHALQGRRNAAVYVGALHLVGKDGLVQLLRNAGYAPEQMYGVDHLERRAVK
jgi:uncharacterized protein